MLRALVADRARIAELEAQILDLERSLAVLRLEKTAAQNRLDSYKYPVLTLPTEITSEIFIHFLPRYPLCPPFVGPLSPTLLTHVCREWRDIALANPVLWRAISLSEIRTPFDPRHIWLSASSCYPVSISIVSDDYADVPEDSELLAAVLPFRSRWEYLKLHLSDTLLPAVEGGMPLLRHLDLELYDDIFEAFTFLDASLLRTVILDVVAANNVFLPWTQLTCLTLRFISLYNCLSILRQTTNLVHCTLDLCGSDENDLLPDIMLPSLQSLCWIDLDDNDPLADCLDAFIVPSLRSLQVTEQLIRPDPVDFLTSFISKSGCNLQAVGIMGERWVHKESYHRAFPSIQKFFFDDEYVVIDGLSEPDSSNV